MCAGHCQADSVKQYSCARWKPHSLATVVISLREYYLSFFNILSLGTYIATLPQHIFKTAYYCAAPGTFEPRIATNKEFRVP